MSAYEIAFLIYAAGCVFVTIAFIYTLKVAEEYASSDEDIRRLCIFLRSIFLKHVFGWPYYLVAAIYAISTGKISWKDPTEHKN